MFKFYVNNILKYFKFQMNIIKIYQINSIIIFYLQLLIILQELINEKIFELI